MRNCWGLGTSRSIAHDLSFGFRQLIDIADRALSAGINDPTTAVQVIDELHGLLLDAGRRPRRSPYLHDEGGQVRVVLRALDFGDLAALTVGEIAHHGADDPRVRRRLAAMIDDLDDAVRSEYRRGLADLRQRLVDTRSDESTNSAGQSADEDRGAGEHLAPLR